MNLTVVSTNDVLWADDRLLCVMTDGTLAEFVHRGRPGNVYDDGLGKFRWKTAEQLVELCREANTYHRELTRPLGRFQPRLAGLSYGGDSIASRRGWDTYR